VKLLLDARLPLGLANQLSAAGRDATHVFSLPRGNRTPDAAIAVHA
jgi:predicted nuclease of predicted toxin-antitoxin system